MSSTRNEPVFVRLNLLRNLLKHNRNKKRPDIKIISKYVRPIRSFTSNGLLQIHRKPYKRILNPIFHSRQAIKEKPHLFEGTFPNTEHLKFITILPPVSGRPDLSIIGSVHYRRALLSGKFPRLLDPCTKFGSEFAVLSGSWGFNQSSIGLFGQAPSTKISRDHMEAAYARFCYLIPSPSEYLSPPSAADISTVKTNLDAFPGYKCASLFGSTREKVAAHTIPLAEEMFERVKRPIQPNSHFWVVGGRNKRIKLSKTKDVTSRLFLMPEDVEHRVDSVWASILTDFFGSFSPATSAVHIGQSYMEYGWVDIKEKFIFKEELLKYGEEVVVWEADYSNFDTSIYSELIEFAFEILRSFFPPDRWIDNHFMFMCEKFINKIVLCPNGEVYKMTKGIPSGSAFTNLIGTIVNIVVHMCGLHVALPVGSERDVSLICGGDDSLIALPSVNGIMEKYRNFLYCSTGLNLSPYLPTTYSFSSTWTSEQAPVFFKRQFFLGQGVTWRESDLFENLVFPQEKIGSLSDEISRVIGIISIAPFGVSEYFWVLDYLQYLQEEYLANLALSTDYVRRGFGKNYLDSKGLLLDLDKCSNRFIREPPLFEDKVEHLIPWDLSKRLGIPIYFKCSEAEKRFNRDNYSI